MISRVILKIDTNRRKKEDLKHQCFDLCDFSDAYIIVKGTITVAGTDNKSRKNRPLAFKNNAPFISCISKINNTLIDNAEDLDVAMPITIWLNTVNIIQRQQAVCGIITEMN